MERGSKFLSFAWPVENEEEAQLVLQAIKKDHPKARHYCSAMRLHPDGSLERYNDDGEPSGSAGRPILGQLIKNNLTHVFIVVVRYFGGTKLGIPGLMEAYKTSAANALAAGTIIEKRLLSKVMIRMAHEAFPPFLNFCKQHFIPVFKESFGEKANLLTGFKKSSAPLALLEALRQYTGMDFGQLDEYKTYLGFEIEFLKEDVIF